jgi:hypothetical protein
VFKSFTESNSEMHVELGMGTKHAVKGSGTVPFWMESGGTCESDRCVMGARTQEECALSLND